MLNLEPRTLKKISGAELYSYLRVKSSLSEIFHENTKTTPFLGRAYGQHIARILKSPIARRLMTAPGKVYTLMDRVDLEPAAAETDLEKVIEQRRSVRHFSGAAVPLAQLGKLLRFSYGATSPRGYFRAVSSAGGLYPLELYIVPHRVDGLEDGIYHYDPDRHGLDVVSREPAWVELKRCLNLQDMKDPDSASMIVVISAIFRRSTIKYLDRGYRLVLMEAGEVGQNLSLMATSLGLGCYMLGGFYDDALSRLLQIDGVDEAPLLPLVLGARPENGAGV